MLTKFSSNTFSKLGQHSPTDVRNILKITQSQSATNYE